MATSSKKLQPIIIKRIRKFSHPGHSGSWKIAYADFVTAMMAFFLLMWLLGSVNEGDLKGLQDYFKNPVKASLNSGRNTGESSSLLPGGGKDLTQRVGQVKRGEVVAKAEQERRQFNALRNKISALIASNPKLNPFAAQIRLEITPDGLQIQIIDDQNRAMFDTGSAQLKPYMREILIHIAQALEGVENKIGLDGHTDQAPYSHGERHYGNWELSADRANASRREMVAAGLADSKVARVVGFSSSNLLDPLNPLNPMNRRISILVMGSDAASRLMEPFRTDQMGKTSAD